jgi:hypothetical protein
MILKSILNNIFTGDFLEKMANESAWAIVIAINNATINCFCSIIKSTGN